VGNLTFCIRSWNWSLFDSHSPATFVCSLWLQYVPIYRTAPLTWADDTGRVIVISMVALFIGVWASMLGLAIAINVYSKGMTYPDASCTWLKLTLSSSKWVRDLRDVRRVSPKLVPAVLVNDSTPHPFIVGVTHVVSQVSTHGLRLSYYGTCWLQIGAELPPYSQQILVQCSVHEGFGTGLVCVFCNVSHRNDHIHTQ
jgi:hypothetical protein